MSKSSRQALVVPIQLEKHKNADLLSIVRVDDFQCVVNTKMWIGIDTACFIEPESIVNTDKDVFSFLKREGRTEEVIRAKRLRGEWSVGLLVPTPDGFNIGDNLWDYFELKHFEPIENALLRCGDAVSGPSHWINVSKFDVENYRKYNRVFQDGELVGLSEKAHGSFGSWVYSDGSYHVKSRGFWRSLEDNDYSLVLKQCEPLMKYLRDNENTLCCGEVIGRVQKGFSYGVENGKVDLRLFDIRKPDYSYRSVQEFRDIVESNNLPAVKIVGDSVLIPHDKDLILSLSEGNTLEKASHIREGIVIRPANERYESKLNGRCILKCVSNSYLEKQGR